jgi:glycerophosphoryl diester phosphodiesterase
MANRPLLLGHRGNRSVPSISENSLAAFDRALEDGCDGFEFDVRLTGDGGAVVCHDPKFRHVTIAGAMQAQLTELPTVEMVLARYASHAFLDIELKVPGLESCIARVLEQHPPARGYVVSSFLPEVLHSLHALDPKIPLGFILDRDDRLSLWSELPIEFIIPHYALVAEELIESVHTAGKRLFVWTVNTESRLLQLANWGVDGVISDDTRQLSRVLGRR